MFLPSASQCGQFAISAAWCTKSVLFRSRPISTLGVGMFNVLHPNNSRSIGIPTKTVMIRAICFSGTGLRLKA